MSSRDATVIEIRKRIESIEEEVFRMAFMYQFLIGGEPSEVCGKYAPKGTDAHRVEISVGGKKTHAVAFVVKTARRNGIPRLSVIPLDPQIEPWVKIVLDWFHKHGDGMPFELGKRKTLIPKHNKNTFQVKARDVFNGLEWLTESARRKGIRRYKPFRASAIRDLRRKNLKEFYHFNELDLALFGSWNEPVVDLHIKTEIESVLSKANHEKSIPELLKLAKTYIGKLFRPISQLGQEEVPLYLQVRDYTDLFRRYNRSAEISTIVKDINTLGQAKLGNPFLKENMRIVLEMLSPCESDIQFTTKIASLAALFEVELESLKTIIQKPNWRRNNRIIKKWLKMEKITYNPEIFETWSHIKALRNMEPIHSETDPSSLMVILKYFGEPMSLPIKYSSLWDEILDKFKISLEHFRQILNEYKVI